MPKELREHPALLMNVPHSRSRVPCLLWLHWYVSVRVQEINQPDFDQELETMDVLLVDHMNSNTSNNLTAAGKKSKPTVNIVTMSSEALLCPYFFPLSIHRNLPDG